MTITLYSTLAIGMKTIYKDVIIKLFLSKDNVIWALWKVK